MEELPETAAHTGPYAEQDDFDDYSYMWQAVNNHAIAKWVRWTSAKTGIMDVTGPLGILIYPSQPSGLVDNESMRLPLSRLRFQSPEAYPTWVESGTFTKGMSGRDEEFSVPTDDELRSAWEATSRFRDAETRNRKRSVSVSRAFSRRSNESTDAFYQRVAKFYTAAAVVSGRPVQALSDAADVPRSTASQWVFQARQRGYLPKTRAGRSRASAAEVRA